MIIYVTGRAGAGKTTVADMLEARGFKKFEMSDVIKAMMRAEGVEITGPSTRAFAIAQRDRYGPAVFAQKLLDPLMDLEFKEDVVISGGRSEEEISFLKANLQRFIPISVDAPANLRFDRLRAMGGTFGHATQEDFMAREAIERSVGIEAAIAHAEHKLNNAGSLQELGVEIDRLLALIGVVRRPVAASARVQS